MKKFDNELAAMQDKVSDMAQLAKSMVVAATGAVKDRSTKPYAEIAQNEQRLDEMQVEIDQQAVRLLTVYGPVATDLRYLLVVTHMTAQLERMGDQVINVIESLELMRTDPECGTLSDLQQMADLVAEIVDDALQSYFARDAERAQATRGHDDLVDALNAKIMKQLLSDEDLQGVLNGTKDIADALAQILIARHLERIADQAVNICKEVVYMIRGDDVRHAQK